MKILRFILRKFHLYIVLREAMREGLLNSWKRLRIQRKILKTKPITTAKDGEIEIRVLTWRKDYINLIWALKSFYSTSQVDYPLYIHDGGLFESHKRVLLYHFPQAHIIDKDEADQKVNLFFEQNNLPLSKAYRQSNIATVKLWDYFIMSKAQRIISIDSDIIFFQKPDLIISKDIKKNYYNEDLQFAYSMTVEDIEKNFSLKIPEKINSGLFNVAHDIFNAEQIEQWLKNEQLYQNKWVTEQTLHAMLSAHHRDGVHLLPKNYIVSTTPGLTDETVCKHYPGFFRPFFFQEGIPKFYKSPEFSSIST
ncbi:MAG: hypothetical protein CME60_13030 [Halobacteriovoraceae bacterium]|nr:hypothetical protein [Halobacteriovoraceae bacterium]|tara:strand:+ start:114 stop:1037 length:924 start_codon:yes stop_codon:yes gene_type:complete